MKKIIVFGLGGIGGYVGARIALGRAQDLAAAESAHAAAVGEPELAFIARGEHLSRIQQHGLRFRDPSGTESVVHPALATANAAEFGKADLVLLCVKGYALPAACQAVAPVVGSHTVVLPLLNGADIYERVRAQIRNGIVLPGAIYISAAIQEPGFVAHLGGKGNVVTGREPGNVGFDQQPLLGVFKRAGIPCEWFEDPMSAIWSKYLFIASFGLVTGMSGKPFGEVVADPELSDLVRRIQGEIVALSRAKGIALPADAAENAFKAGASFPPATKTSYQRDLEVSGKPNEGDLFGGTIIRLGKELGVPTPVTAQVVAKIG